MPEAEARDVLVLVGRASDLGEMPPYGIWLDVLARLPSREDLPARPRVFAERGVIGAASSRLEILDEALAFFRRLAACGPLVIVLDDLQWADAAALDLLRLLAREAHTLRLLVLATYRAEDAPTGSPLAQLLLTVQREGQPRWLNLAPLTMQAILELATTRYGLLPGDAKRLTHYLFQHSEGNPFFVVNCFEEWRNTVS